MNLGVAAATLALVVPAELPDKTFISTIILSSRHRPAPVWVGTSLGLVLQAGVAVVLGRLLAFAPRHVVDAVVAALFAGGAAYLLFWPERKEVEAGAELAAEEEHLSGEDRDAALGQRTSAWRIVGASFTVVALAEVGDLTQVLIANLAARTRDALSVFVGGAVGFVLIAAVGVLAGRALVRVVPVVLVRRLSGLALIGLAIWSLLGALGV